MSEKKLSSLLENVVDRIVEEKKLEKNEKLNESKKINEFKISLNSLLSKYDWENLTIIECEKIKKELKEFIDV